MTALSHGEKVAVAVCLGISATLILRLWCVHRHDRFIKKFFWSVVLLLPLIGWTFYGAWYTPLPPNSVFTSGKRYGDASG